MHILGLEITFGKSNVNVSVSRVSHHVIPARKICLLALNAPKLFELTSELTNRIQKSYIQKLLAVGNKIIIMYYGKKLIFEIHSIECEEEQQLVDEFVNLSIDDKRFKLCVSVDKTQWKLFK